MIEDSGCLSLLLATLLLGVQRSQAELEAFGHSHIGVSMKNASSQCVHVLILPMMYVPDGACSIIIILAFAGDEAGCARMIDVASASFPVVVGCGSIMPTSKAMRHETLCITILLRLLKTNSLHEQ